MKISYSLKSKMTAILLTIAISHLSLVIAFAAPQITGKLITQGNLPVTVNGNSVQGGASIVSGAVIETPDNVSATIQLGDLGEVELTPGTLAVIEFTGNSVKVTLKRGCATLTANKGTTGSLVNDQNKTLSTTGSAQEAKADGLERRSVPACAGAVFSGTSTATATVPAAGGVGGGGLSGAAIGAIIAGIGGAAIIGGIIGFSGDSSPSSPRR